MVSALARNIVLSSPLLAQSFRLLSFTGGAHSLATVNTIERMAIFARLFLRIYRRHRPAVVQRVLTRCNQPKVSGIDAMTVSADVIDKHPLRNVAFGHKIRNAVGATVFPAEVKGAVPISIKWGSPKMAIALCYPLRIKSRSLRRCDIAHYRSLRSVFTTRSITNA